MDRGHSEGRPGRSKPRSAEAFSPRGQVGSAGDLFAQRLDVALQLAPVWPGFCLAEDGASEGCEGRLELGAISARHLARLTLLPKRLHLQA